MTRKDTPAQTAPQDKGSGAPAGGRAAASLAIALENVNAESLERIAGTDSTDKSGSPEARNPGGPRITASGRGAVAEQILQIAFERGIKVRKDRDLAEILSVVEVESEIPLAALAGVAEILRYLYQTDAGTADGPARAAAGDTANTAEFTTRIDEEKRP